MFALFSIFTVVSADVSHFVDTSFGGYTYPKPPASYLPPAQLIVHQPPVYQPTAYQPPQDEPYYQLPFCPPGYSGPNCQSSIIPGPTKPPSDSFAAAPPTMTPSHFIGKPVKKPCGIGVLKSLCG